MSQIKSIEYSSEWDGTWQYIYKMNITTTVLGDRDHKNLVQEL